MIELLIDPAPTLEDELSLYSSLGFEEVIKGDDHLYPVLNPVFVSIEYLYTRLSA